jgi:hypothetical protein
MTTHLKAVITDAPKHGHTDSRLQLYANCGTGVLGSHRRSCPECGESLSVPNACRSRACPFCRNRERAEWVRAQEAALPAVPYFHVVFTVPRELRALARADPGLFYRILLDACRQALLRICADPKHLGVTPCAFAVLHTWDQKLGLHPHVHVVVSSGGLDPDGAWRWSGVTRKKAFLVPLKVLRKHFRTVLSRALIARYHDSEPWRQHWPDETTFAALFRPLRNKTWCVHLERPLGGPQAVVRYLARYVNRVAVAPQRVAGYDGETVELQWQDRNHGNARCIEPIPAYEFLRRFRQHIPPKGLVRIRYWGCLAHRCRESRLRQCAEALRKAPPPPRNLPRIRCDEADEADQGSTPLPGMACPQCGAIMIYAGHHRRRDEDPDPFR